MEKQQSYQQMTWGQLDNHKQKNDVGSLYMQKLYKNSLKTDKYLKVKTKTMKLLGDGIRVKHS